MMLKTVKFKNSLGHYRFGCNEQHFEHYIKDMPLKVVSEFEQIALVEDSTGEQFTVRKSDFAIDKEMCHD